MTALVLDDAPAVQDARAVFISYSSRDDVVAQQVCAHLEGSGIRCWMAPRDIPAGLLYADVIVKAMDAARLVVLVFSQAANDSNPVRNEVELASHRGLPILPLIVEAVTPSGGMEYYLRSRHWKNAVEGPLADSLRQLHADVQLHLSRNPHWDTPRRLSRRLLNQVGGATLIVAAMLAAIGVVVFIFRSVLVPAERWLAAAGLAGTFGIWLVAHWGGVFNRNRRLVAFKAFVTAVLLATWSVAAIRTHRLPTFDKPHTGILVARIAGDGNRQARVIAELEGLAQTSGGIDDDPLQVRALPRRIWSAEEARQFARTSAASVVVWGRVVEGLVQARVTMADGEGIYDADGPILGSADLAVEDAADYVQESLVNFLGAYQDYQKRRYAAALERFEKTLEDLQRNPSISRANYLTPVEAALSTLYFYLATTRYQLVLKTGDRTLVDRAISEYETSIAFASKMQDVSGFATPVANLAGILLARGGTGDLENAKAKLESTACETQRAFAPIPCLYIEYHRGVIDNYQHRYVEGRGRFDHLMTVSWPAVTAGLPDDSPHHLLPPYVLKNRAYAEARLADTAPSANRDGYLNAEQHWLDAERRLAAQGRKVPPEFFLTRARIHVGLRRTKEAKAALRVATAGGVADPDVHLVGAAVARCEGDIAAAGAEEAAYAVKTRTLVLSGRRELAGAMISAKAYWNAFERVCASAKETP
jgi:hypothetical protein